MKKVFFIFAIALAAAFLARSQTESSRPRKSELDGIWELVSGQQLPNGTRDVKIMAGGHFIFVAYDKEKGKPLYTGGGTFILNGRTYKEHIDFMSDGISEGMIGKDQSFTVRMGGDMFTQTGVLSNGKELLEMWKRASF
jgi:hypothetical protein